MANLDFTAHLLSLALDAKGAQAQIVMAGAWHGCQAAAQLADQL
jgi:hypothetical protein